MYSVCPDELSNTGHCNVAWGLGDISVDCVATDESTQLQRLTCNYTISIIYPDRISSWQLVDLFTYKHLQMLSQHDRVCTFHIHGSVMISSNYQYSEFFIISSCTTLSTVYSLHLHTYVTQTIVLQGLMQSLMWHFLPAKKGLQTYVDSVSIDQPAHPHSLIWELHCLLISQWYPI